MNEPLHVLLATAQPLVRAGLRASLVAAGYVLLGDALTGAMVIQTCRLARPDILLLDVRLTDPPVLDTVVTVRRDHPGTRVIALAPIAEVGAVRPLLAIGASGVVSLDDQPETVVEALRSVVQHGAWCSPALLAALAQEPDPGSPLLTPREREVLTFLATGRRNAEIAAALAVSVRTVEFHIGHLLQKLGARSRTEALQLAHERGLLTASRQRMVPVVGHTALSGDFRVCYVTAGSRSRHQRDDRL